MDSQSTEEIPLSGLESESDPEANGMKSEASVSQENQSSNDEVKENEDDKESKQEEKSDKAGEMLYLTGDRCQNCETEMKKYHRYYRCKNRHVYCIGCDDADDDDDVESKKCGQCGLILIRLNSSADCKYCFIYVDNSNIWIGAKAFTATSSVRINTGQIKNIVLQGKNENRELAQASAFLSVSAESSTKRSSVTSCYEKCGFTVKCFPRNPSTNKEKQVDCAIVADITEVASNPIFPKGVIAVFTGDEDIIPGLRKALKRKKCTVEIYSWISRTSAKLHDLKKEYPTSVTIFYLDYVPSILFFKS